MAAIAQAHSVRHPQDIAERVLQENPDRYCMFPIHFDNMWQGFKKTETAFWTAEDLNLAQDPADWRALSEGERQAVASVLAYLLTSDSLLVENLALRFLQDVEQPEARAFYSFQAFKQNVHSEAFGMVVANLMDDDEQGTVFRAVRSNPVLKTKAEWAKKWMSSEGPFAERLLAFAVMESVFNCTSFLSFFSLKKRGVLPGLCQANDLISRDEGINVEFHSIVYSELQSKVPLERLREILGEAVAIEKEFAGAEGINVEALGLKLEEVQTYIEFVGDQLAATFGYERLFKAPNPFNWLETIALKGAEVKAAAADAKASGFSTAQVLKQVENRTYTLAFDEDF